MVELDTVTPPVTPVKSMSLQRRGTSTVIVCDAANAALMTTLSCGSGTREVHFVTSDQLPPAVPCHVCVAAVVKVMPELPPASPTSVPPVQEVDGEAERAS